MDGWIVALVVDVLLLALVLGTAIFLLVRRRGRPSGGWGRLAESWATDRPAPAGARPGQTVQVGSVIYKRCVEVGVSDAGLFLSPSGIGRLTRNPALLIPWPAISGVERTRLYWQRAARLAVGQPPCGTITVHGAVLEAVAPWLSPRSSPS